MNWKRIVSVIATLAMATSMFAAFAEAIPEASLSQAPGSAVTDAADSVPAPEDAPADVPSEDAPLTDVEDPAPEGTQDVVVSVEPAGDPSADDVPLEEPDEVIEDDKDLDAASVTAFVQRLYRVGMGREADASGLNTWVTGLLYGGQTGASVAHGFFDSKEYKAMNRTDYQYVNDLYSAMFDRAADQQGLATWTAFLDGGMSRDYVYAGFVNGVEFKNLCARYGISPGTYTSGQPRDQNPSVTAFVQRLYQVVFSRKGDESGLNDWTNRLIIRDKTGAQVVQGFFGSGEYTRQNKSDDQYIADLYRAMFDRAGDAGGVATWKKSLYNGLSRTWVINGFAGGTEFKNLCARYGIDAGSVSSGQSRDKDPLVTEFVTALNRYLLGRPTPSENELNVYTSMVLVNKMSGPALVRKYTEDPAFIQLSQYVTPNDGVTMLYNGLLGRENDISSYEKSTYVTLWVNGGLTAAMEAMLKSDEFKNRCKSHNIPYTDSTYTPGTLTVKVGGSTVTMDTLRTVAGVCQAELTPTMLNYPEAVKAQAVAAHSMIVANHNAGNKAPAINWKEPTQQVKDIVTQVINEFVLYNNGTTKSVALTPYYSHSPYATSQSAADAWHTSAYPYLTAQSTEYDYLAAKEGGFSNVDQTVRINSDELAAIFNAMYNSDGKHPIEMEGSTSQVITVYKRNSDGTVANFLTHVKWYDPSKGWVRNSTPSAHYFWMNACKVLGINKLPSSVIKNVTYAGYSGGKSYWDFTFVGKATASGSCVGMSQWTAYGFARYQATSNSATNMNDYKKILLHFYNTVKRGTTGTNACTVEKLSG